MHWLVRYQTLSTRPLSERIAQLDNEMKKNTTWLGPLQWCAAFLRSETANVILKTYSVEPLLSSGIALSGFKNFLGTPTGQKYDVEHGSTISMHRERMRQPSSRSAT